MMKKSGSEENAVSQERRVRIGVLGCSDIARRRFLPALLKADNAVLAAVASRDRAKAERFSREFGGAGRSYDALLSSPEVELVYLSLPNHLHEEWTLRALESGKHVICEKPLGLSPASVERMAARARSGKLLLYENMMYLHHPQHRLVRDMIDRGTIGKVVSLRTAFGFHLPASRGFRLDPDRGGGAFHDLIRYPLSTALYFLKGPEYRFSGYSSMRGALNVGMTACAATSEGENFSFTIGFEQQYECWYELVGDRGKLRVDRAYTTPADLVNTIEVTIGTERSSVPAPAADHFTLMIEHVCRLVLQSGRYDQDTRAAAQRMALLAEQVWTSCEPISIGK